MVKAGGMRTFIVIWAGQALSMMGSGLTGFALGVWIFQRTGSATQFAMIALAATLPAVLISPFAGVFVDRWDRRLVLIVSDSLAALTTAILALLFWRDALELWHILVASSVGACMGAFQGPAYMASVTLLVPKEQYGRASGMAQMARAMSNVMAPFLAGLLMVSIGVTGILLIDLGSFLFAMLTLLIVRIPRPSASEAGRAARGGVWSESRQGWTYIRAREGLFGMLMLFAALNFMLSAVNALTAPMLLSFTTPDRLGGILSLGGVGMLVGSIAMSIWGGPRRKIHGLLGYLIVLGFGVALVGLRPSALVVTSGFFLVMICVPVVNGSAQAIWQRKVPADLQGRVFATRGMISMAAMPLAYLISGPLADRIFNPMLTEGGALVAELGHILGVGPGRGIGLMFVIAGLGTTLASAAAYLNPRIRKVEEELPDAEEPEAAAP
jgi:MFS transporter, DHA3 family, macrolide efflux protein